MTTLLSAVERGPWTVGFVPRAPYTYHLRRTGTRSVRPVPAGAKRQLAAWTVLEPFEAACASLYSHSLLFLFLSSLFLKIFIGILSSIMLHGMHTLSLTVTDH